MKHLLRTIGGAVLLAAPGPCREAIAQEPGDPALLRAKVIEEQEGDLRAAEAAYRALIDDQRTAAGARDEALLHLGRMWWRLGREQEARELLARVQQSGGERGAAATAILQGQGPEGQAAADVAARARDAIARLLGEKPETGDARQDLKWLGAAAVPEVLRQLGERREHAVVQLADLERNAEGRAMASLVLDRGGYRPQDGPRGSGLVGIRAAQTLAEAVWSAGGVEAERFLRGALADEDVRWRRIVASGSKAADAALLPLVAQLLQDGDPDGTVPVLALANAERLPLDAIVAQLPARVAAVRARAWRAIAGLTLWQQGRPQTTKDDAVRLLEPHLTKALGDPDPETARTAFQFLYENAATTVRGADLLLEWLPRVPSFQQPDLQSPAPTAQPSVAAVMRAAKALGPFGTADGRDDRRAFLRVLGNNVLNDPACTAAQICDLVDLGYDKICNNLLARAVVLARTDDDFERIAVLLEHNAQPGEAARKLSERDLPAAALEGLQRRLASVLPRTRQGTREQPLSQAEQNEANEAQYLFTAIGRTGNPAAVPLLEQQLSAFPFWGDTIAGAALLLSDRSRAAEVAGLLRELLVSKALDEFGWHRNLVFAELAERGDAEAIQLYSKGYELGLASSVRSEQDLGRQRRGVQWLSSTLVSTSSSGQQTMRKLHGYDDTQLAAAWRTLLQSPALPEVLVDVAGLDWNAGALPDPILLQLAEVLAQRLPELWKQFDDSPSADDDRDASRRLQPNVAPQIPPVRARDTLRKVAQLVARNAPAGDDAPSKRYRDAMAALLASDELGGVVVSSLGREAVPALADRIRILLAGRSSFDAMQALQNAGVPLSTDDLLACLRSQGSRAQFLNRLPPDAPAEILRQVEAMVRDPEQYVRLAACSALGRTLSADSVAALLPALRDPDSEVRTAATEALQRIRLYHEQKAFWDQFQQGVTTGREAATAKLLIQAKPDQRKEQRLLALRSLGALGAPEALPYLIEWSQDADAEVAAAAREAIGRIHQQAGIK